MTFKKEKEIADFVHISSSDDEDIARVRTKKRSLTEIISQFTTKVLGRQASQSSQPQPQPQPQPLRSADVTPSVADYTNLHSRSFWKAGSVDVLPTAKSQVAQGELEHARVHPKFLHSNATSHKWAFGAIAELLDNAIDEVNIILYDTKRTVLICISALRANKLVLIITKVHNGATFVKVDKIDIKDNSPALLFQDDGGGMEPSGLRKCMSLGYSSKKSDKTIGQYGNGFKTSTMRLGADVIVFSRATRAGQATQSVGLLSYTFLRKTGQDDVIVPMLDFDVSGHWAEPIMYGSQDDWNSTLKIILEWSPFTSKEDLMAQFEDIGPHGTKIIIYNLWLNDEGIYELSFDDDDEDIRLRDEAHRGGLVKLSKKTMELQSHISYQIRYSLRAYASILYLRKFTNFQIILRGKAVQQFSIVDDLKYLKVVTYKPQLPLASKEVNVETTIGFIKEAPDLGVSGFNVYHKNRLIMPFWKVTRDGSSRGNGVVGVLEANFMEPAHDKQEFERSLVFIRLETRLKQMVAEYWKTHCHYVGHHPPGFSAQKTQKNPPPLPSVRNSVNFGKRVAEQINVSAPIGLCGKPENTRGQINHDKNLDFVQHTSGPGAEYEVVDVDNLDDPGALSADEIREENIRLFMRCEEHLQNQIKFKQKIQDLEKELKEAKMKRDQVLSYVESRKKLKALKGEFKRF